MDYEQKYKAALTTAKQWIKDGCEPSTKICLELLFPELRESEDERISDTIFNCLYQCCDTGFISGKQRDGALAWLEEQKDKNCLACDQHLKGYIAGRKVTEEEKQKEQEPITDSVKFEEGFKAGREFERREQKPAGWSEEDEEMLEYIIGDVNDAKQLYTTKEAKDMADKEIAWLKSLRQQKKPDCDGCAKHLEGYINGRTDAENKLLEKYGIVETPDDELHMKPR